MLNFHFTVWSQCQTHISKCRNRYVSESHTRDYVSQWNCLMTRLSYFSTLLFFCHFGPQVMLSFIFCYFVKWTPCDDSKGGLLKTECPQRVLLWTWYRTCRYGQKAENSFLQYYLFAFYTLSLLKTSEVDCIFMIKLTYCFIFYFLNASFQNVYIMF